MRHTTMCLSPTLRLVGSRFSTMLNQSIIIPPHHVRIKAVQTFTQNAQSQHLTRVGVTTDPDQAKQTIGRLSLSSQSFTNYFTRQRGNGFGCQGPHDRYQKPTPPPISPNFAYCNTTPPVMSFDFPVTQRKHSQNSSNYETS